ncbi:MAG: hypothetical protein EOM64_07885 [Erysipelotrichia bacterium]|nr:hypothetical protein [Erysipelotrichia bacterium]
MNDTFSSILSSLNELLGSEISTRCFMNQATAVYEKRNMILCSMDVPLSSMNIIDGMFFLVL